MEILDIKKLMDRCCNYHFSKYRADSCNECPVPVWMCELVTRDVDTILSDIESTEELCNTLIPTRQSKLLELFPNAQIENGVCMICPNSMGAELDGSHCTKTDCETCRKNYWLADTI